MMFSYVSITNKLLSFKKKKEAKIDANIICCCQEPYSSTNNLLLPQYEGSAQYAT